MKVQKIRLTGFKSFVDETVIELQDGITAIVGPNGCGKSNILDAVRWVLGEKSGKALRGQSMEDVIFLGSEHRKQAGMAEVEIYFDNKDRSLAVEQDEVTIARRLYLNSASEYYLNGKRTTRREIEAILMDTGIGKSAYSIMEQGRISEILKASPENRRELLDEAAGISRFKAERKETLARLHDTEQNLLRLSDILKGKESEIQSLERQAQKTRKYRALKEKLDEHDRRLRYLKHKRLSEKNEKSQGKLDLLLKKRDELMERVKKAESDIAAFEAQTQEQLEEMHRLDKAFHKDLSNLENMRRSIERLQNEKEARENKLRTEKKRYKEELQTQKGLEKKYQESLQLELELKEDLKNLFSEKKKITEIIQKLRAEMQGTLKKEEENKSLIAKGELQQAELLESLQNVTRDLIIELEQHKKELEKREEYRSRLKEAIMMNLHEATDALSEAKGLIRTNKTKEALRSIENIHLENVINDFLRYETIEQEFRSLFFDRSGLLARKEALDEKMQELQETRKALQEENQHLAKKQKILIKEIDDKKNRHTELDIGIRDHEVRKESTEEARRSIQKQLEACIRRKEFHEEEIIAIEREFQEKASEERELRKQVQDFEERTKKQSGNIDKLKRLVEKSRDKTEALRRRAEEAREKFEAILPSISQQERNSEAVRLQLNVIEEDLYNDYQMSPSELYELCKNKRLQIEKEEERYSRYQKEIRELGAFNALAIEELERAKESYDELLNQKKDIESAQKNILQILKEINEKSQEMFQDTFERIQTNFREIFQTLFGGGKAELSLSDPQNPLHSGVEIMVQPPGKKNTTLSLLSGGEQSMTAIALMFAIYLVRPSPFCFLDEIDAPLDDTNVGRFLKMLLRFTSRTQFLVITHNKLTMAQAGAIFGVTQEEAGISKIISVQISDAFVEEVAT